MNSIGDIDFRLQNIIDRVEAHTGRMEREREALLQIMSKAQEAFGKTKEGQNIVLSISEALNDLINADSLLYALKSGILEYESRIRK